MAMLFFVFAVFNVFGQECFLFRLWFIKCEMINHSLYDHSESFDFRNKMWFSAVENIQFEPKKKERKTASVFILEVDIFGMQIIPNHHQVI